MKSDDETVKFSKEQIIEEQKRLKKQKAKVAALREAFPMAFAHPTHSLEHETALITALLRLERDGEISLVVHKSGFAIPVRRKKV